MLAVALNGPDMEVNSCLRLRLSPAVDADVGMLIETACPRNQSLVRRWLLLAQEAFDLTCVAMVVSCA